MSVKAWCSVDDDGRITSSTTVEEFSEGMQPFDFPDDFDFGLQGDYKIVDGELVRDGAWTKANEASYAETEAARAAETQRITAMSLFVQTADLTDEQALTVSTLYPEWKMGAEYEARQIVRDAGHLFRCAQKHTSSEQNNTSVASLWTQIDKAGDGVDVWQQPTGAHDAYNKGDRVHYPDADGPIYVSLIDGNTWSPDAYPAGWKLEGGAE